ncbi:M20/M25/M40 family metallo-hydrolase [Streptomyces sp. NPDC047515]|uniref:M20/M25/M40 family metallo-hydrolase n=1 Tax=Streptomyces sp. NPDC047515 TaxID=3155380 RepID=UPI0033D056DD
MAALSHSLQAEPELAYEEYRSVRKIAEELERGGFDVTRGVAGLPTAFTATVGSGDLVIGICAEYDTLPGIGHACGHNVNGASATAAAVALAPLADEMEVTVKLLGTPAEEYGGGKADMPRTGLFDDMAMAGLYRDIVRDLGRPVRDHDPSPRSAATCRLDGHGQRVPPGAHHPSGDRLRLRTRSRTTPISPATAPARARTARFWRAVRPWRGRRSASPRTWHTARRCSNASQRGAAGPEGTRWPQPD